MVDIRAKVSLKVGKDSDIPSELLSFNGLESGKEHVAFIFKDPEQKNAVPLMRMHSECLTGDVFHSSRCDCGEQLNETIEKMGKQGGILLYLRQEGRGIGLYNKIDAYELQSQGMNTYEANNHLGFADDLRSFEEAALMLKAMGVEKVRLITNNPKKINDLKSFGIEITETIGTEVHMKDGNENYLAVKASHGKHRFKLD